MICTCHWGGERQSVRATPAACHANDRDDAHRRYSQRHRAKLRLGLTWRSSASVVQRLIKATAVKAPAPVSITEGVPN